MNTMKASIVVILAAAAASTTSAQEILNARITVDVPFAFHHKDRSLPAGRYKFRQGPASGSLSIADAGGRNLSVATFLFDAVELNDRSGFLRFKCYEGGLCFLSELKGRGWNRKMMIQPSRLETETRQTSAGAIVDTPLATDAVAKTHVRTKSSGQM